MNELLQMLNSLNIYNSHENVLILDSNTIQRIFQDFIPKVLSQKQIKRLNSEPIPEDVSEKNFLRLMIASKYMCEKLNIHDFSYKDLMGMDPDIKRIKLLLTELARFALHKQKMKDDIIPVYNHYQNAFTCLQELFDQTQSAKAQLEEEKQYSKQLLQQYNEKLKLQKTVESSYQITKQSAENLSQIYMEEQGKLQEKSRLLSQSTDQLLILQDKKRQLLNRVVCNIDQLQQQYQNSEIDVETYQNGYAHELKYKNLLEFKTKVFMRFRDKLVNVISKLDVMKQNKMKQAHSHELIIHCQKELKLLENQCLEQSKQIAKAKEHLLGKEQSLNERNSQHSQIKAQQQQSVQSLETDIMQVHDLVEAEEAQIKMIKFEKKEKQQNMLNLVLQQKELYQNSRQCIQNTIDDIDSYASEINQQLNLI